MYALYVQSTDKNRRIFKMRQPCENLCKGAQKVTATGTVQEENGKKVLTASKIELVK
jgi:hypothetical protein